MYHYEAKVVKVVDGDTIDLDIDLGLKISSRQRVRLKGINTPEMRSRDEKEREAGKEARRFVVERVANKFVEVETEKQGKFGRYLATIYYGDNSANLNKELLEKGLAVPFMVRKREQTEGNNNKTEAEEAREEIKE